MSRHNAAVVLLAAIHLCHSGRPARAAPTLYAMSVNHQRLLRMDPTTAETELVGELGTDVQDIAFDTRDGFLYGYDFQLSGRLLRIDPNDASWTEIGPSLSDLGFAPVHGMAYDPARDRLYATSIERELIEVVPQTGEATLLGHMDVFILGLAFDPRTSNLYGTSPFGDPLFRVDTATALTTPVDPTRRIGGGVEGLAFHPEEELLYAAILSGMLATVNPDSGAVTSVASLTGDDFISGLAFSPEPSTLFLLVIALALPRRRV